MSALPLLFLLMPIAQDKIAFPDPVVIDQDGVPVNFHSGLIKGKTAVVDFIFTSCTVVCRPLTANLRKVQAELGNEARKDVQFISVSVDPAHDTPPVLSTFAQTFHAPSGWRFVTGSKTTIDEILKAARVYTIEPNYHSARVIIGSDSAGWFRLLRAGVPRCAG